MNQRVIVVGGGASGLMAAGRAAEAGAQVILLEKGARLGRKLLLTGNGRCNLTNLASPRDFITRLGPNGVFMRNSLARCDARVIRAFFQQQGVATSADDQGRVYPVSNKYGDILQALHNQCVKHHVRIMTSTAVTGLLSQDGRISGVVTSADQELPAEAVILSTGGKAWPKTGSDGDGYRLLSAVGHHVSPLYPGLVPLVVDDPSLADLEGLSLSQVGITALRDGGRLARTRGDVLVTRDGLSGPVVLNLSNTVTSLLAESRIELLIDLIPQLERAELDANLVAAGQYASDLIAFLGNHIPRRLALYLVGRSSEECSAGELTANKAHLSARQRQALVDLLKRFKLQINRSRPFGEAMVTVGGVRCSEVDPVSFESRLVAGLYITGELLDIAGESGGYNLQCAFTSGWLAGMHAAGARA